MKKKLKSIICVTIIAVFFSLAVYLFVMQAEALRVRDEQLDAYLAVQHFN